MGKRSHSAIGSNRRAPAGQPSWEGRLALGFERRGPRTVLSQRAHRGPILVQRPFYPEGGTCHVYLLHPPGGLVGGDVVDVRVACEREAHALMTTPAANKVYRSKGLGTQQRHVLEVAPQGILEWLPLESILFDGARADITTTLRLGADARILAWDLLCPGRPAVGERFSSGYCRQRFEIWREGTPLLIERTHLDGGSSILDAAWGLGGHAATGILVAAPADDADLNAVRTAVGHDGKEGLLFGATLLDQVVVCRCLGPHAEDVRRRFVRVWESLRPRLLGQTACPPRIWST